MLKNAIAYAEICEICDYMRFFLHNLCINKYPKFKKNVRNFENAIICGKICDMRIFAKYAIARSHITGIPKNWSQRKVLGAVPALLANEF